MLDVTRLRAKLLIAAPLLVTIAASGCPSNSSKPASGAAGSSATGSAVSVGAAGITASAGAPAAGASSATPSVTFSAVYAMMFPMSTNARCNACHGMPANDITNGNLYMGMDQATAYQGLVGQTSMGSLCPGWTIVVAGQPDKSLLVQKLSANAPCGSRMPLGGKQFTDDQLEMIRSWIAGGAKND